MKVYKSKLWKSGVTTVKKMSKTAKRFVEDENYFHRDSDLICTASLENLSKIC